MKTIEYTYNIKDIDCIAAKVLSNFMFKTVILNGSMGSGKTTFVKALIKAMGSKDIVTSPTFSIVNQYKIPNDKVFHFDFYRIESIEEAYNFGVEDYLYSDHWLFIEWPDRIQSIIPKNSQAITITDLDDNTRSLKLTIETENLTKNIAMTETKF
ncbi:tRNA (adenosine(37)-N6)-threonylcarbamoyltransferase complex ATPase subunit type 1 TsaE [Winogradskyella sp. PE311]|uniref:tRNA (adenosine(37)-N6)-threonylcarbamoyltransferase complex ATPase subunit type 1 TsaE n=1 Tax=Winogradskyella sp. PE311 TaxID=3366943 RepID=UPI00397F2CC6